MKGVVEATFREGKQAPKFFVWEDLQSLSCGRHWPTRKPLCLAWSHILPLLNERVVSGTLPVDGKEKLKMANLVQGFLENFNLVLIFKHIKWALILLNNCVTMASAPE